MLPNHSPDTSQRVFLNFGWAAFEQFLKLRGESAGSRVAYLDGVLEIMAPSKSHESRKELLGRLLEMWVDHEGIELASYGSTTLKKKRAQSGAEPDKSYVIGRSELGTIPDLAIEVNWTSGDTNKLKIYHRLGVPEVWFWEDNHLLIFQRRAAGYVKRPKSAVLPTLDVEFFSSFVADADQLRAIRNFRAALRRN